MINHELVTSCEAVGFALTSPLVEMLNEHHSHCSERRGCGYTQATRHLATLINVATPHRNLRSVCEKLFEQPQEAYQNLQTAGAAALLHLSTQLKYEESQLLIRIVQQLLGMSLPELAPAANISGCQNKLKVGSCPMAEKFFLELAHRYITRDGQMNMLVGADGKLLLVEKMNMGDNHSCLSLQPLCLNGVTLPAGSLFAVNHSDPVIAVERRGGQLKGHQIELSQGSKFRFLRLSTLAVSPQNQERAFGTHFQAQINKGLFAPQDTLIDHLRAVAEEETARHQEFSELVPLRLQTFSAHLDQDLSVDDDFYLASRATLCACSAQSVQALDESFLDDGEAGGRIVL